MKLHRNRALLAALALGLVSGAVNAQINLTPETGTAFAPFTYATESLQKGQSFKGKGDNSSTTYYRVTGKGGELNLTFEAGTRIGTADTGLLEITLTGMAFEAPPTSVGFEVATGGAAGETTVLMRYTATEVLAADGNVVIDLNGSGDEVVGITDGHTGGVKVELINATLESVLGSGKARTMVMRPEAVVGKPGVMRTTAATSPTARVSQEFMTFNEDGSHLAAKVGSLQIALPTTAPKDAATWDDVTLADLFDGATSMVKLVGDLSFVADGGVELVATDFMTAATCGTGTDWPIADDKMMTGGLAASTFDTTQHICIQVKADMAIPETSYQIAIDYMPVEDDFVSPIADATVNIGSIERDGTTMHIPFVSTWEGYNHRFMIVNNGPAATYEFTFKSEDGIIAEGGAMASGTLPMGTTHLRASDIVMLTGGSRTAATFTAVAQKKHIEMSSVLATRDNGATDLSILMAE
jgi:hypothetical protein